MTCVCVQRCLKFTDFSTFPYNRQRGRSALFPHQWDQEETQGSHCPHTAHCTRRGANRGPTEGLTPQFTRTESKEALIAQIETQRQVAAKDNITHQNCCHASHFNTGKSKQLLLLVSVLNLMTFIFSLISVTGYLWSWLPQSINHFYPFHTVRPTEILSLNIRSLTLTETLICIDCCVLLLISIQHTTH